MFNEQIKNDLFSLLEKMNLHSEKIKKICSQLNDGKQNQEAIKILKKYRGGLLEEIHDKQKLLDNFDFIINKLKNY